jgi:hypothetical protein
MKLPHLLVTALAAALALTTSPATVARSAAGITVTVVGNHGQSLPHFAYRGQNERGVLRRYVQAHDGANYRLRIRNNTAARVAVVVAVDGRNVVSAEQSSLQRTEPMYVLGAYQTHTIDGWRTDLKTVRRFFFTDPAGSYASALGDTSALGVIAVAAFAERHTPPVHITRPDRVDRDGRDGRDDYGHRSQRSFSESSADSSSHEAPSVAKSGAGQLMQDGAAGHSASPMPAPQAERRAQVRGETLADAQSSNGGRYEADNAAAAKSLGESERSLQKRSRSAGTGFGSASHAPARYTRFTPTSQPFAQHFLKYEWRETLVDLGIIPMPSDNRFWPRYETSRDNGFAPVPPRS